MPMMKFIEYLFKVYPNRQPLHQSVRENLEIGFFFYRQEYQKFLKRAKKNKVTAINAKFRDLPGRQRKSIDDLVPAFQLFSKIQTESVIQGSSINLSEQEKSYVRFIKKTLNLTIERYKKTLLILSKGEIIDKLLHLCVDLGQTNHESVLLRMSASTMKRMFEKLLENKKTAFGNL